MLRGRLINIRPVEANDLSQLHKLQIEIELQGPFLPVSMASETVLRREYEKNGFITESSEKHLVVDAAGEIVGSIWAFRSVPYFDAIEVGFQIFRPSHRGRGFATEAVSLFVSYIFETKQINRIEARVAVENMASEKVITKSGFTLEGVCREAAFSKGKLHDMSLFAMLRSEWSANKAFNTPAARG